MDYEYVENLVSAAKNGNKDAREALADKFSPLIINLSSKAHVNSYDIEDIKNECYNTLFK